MVRYHHNPANFHRTHWVDDRLLGTPNSAKLRRKKPGEWVIATRHPSEGPA